MKILLATTAITLNGGGIASYNNELLAALQEYAVFHLITTESITSFDGVEKVYSLPNMPIKGFTDYKQFINIINDEDYDLIINSDSTIITVIAPFLNSPIITISHTFNNMPAIEAGFNHKYVNKIVALSDAGKKFIEDYFGIKHDGKVCSIYNFIRSDDKCMAGQKSKENALKIVFPGGASMMKHPEMVLLAVDRLLETDLKFKFYWLGDLTLPLAKFSIPKRLEELAHSDSRLVFTNKISREEAVGYIKSANVFILPSRAEGCPMSLIEALTTGCIPVVGSAKHVCREILEHGHFGVIVKQGSSKDLYHKLVDIIQNHSKYAEDYVKTYDYSKKELSEEIWLKKMNLAIKDSLNAPKKTLPLNRFNLYSSIFRFNYHADKKILQEKLLSVWGFIIFNVLFIIRKHDAD